MTAVGEIQNKCKWSHDVKGVERTKLAEEKKIQTRWRRKSRACDEAGEPLGSTSSLSSPALCLRRFHARGVVKAQGRGREEGSDGRRESEREKGEGGKKKITSAAERSDVSVPRSSGQMHLLG